MDAPKALRVLLFWIAASVGGLLLVDASRHHESLWIHAMATMLGMLLGAVAWLCTLAWRRGGLQPLATIYGVGIATGAVICRHIFSEIALGSPLSVVCGAVVTYLIAFTAVWRGERHAA